MINDAAENLIYIMENKINEIRTDLLNIKDKKVIDELINDIKPQILNLYIEFDGVDEEKLEHIRNLKKEYLLLLSLYER
ncbi:hypothetical protein PVK64_14710 [Aliivibrio sp. S4TY2]|uniref:Uncharacterized protein n=1 Tax=Aliivibrio finisterrensis TaxID=511998 RepID=A0A4Q5KSG2_9GAMM|nr:MULTISPECIES: hypothetical protein [Aliivibrio]MDD9157422.1 hypothetical protein [Aliivibrio sp. S4TY2]MDD9161384.1 hypothetical protein [Aliivibrio sp. S4TY1]MDD9165414.1 hypothetical protein [Aliivibrio sp. S4MY2]MDD9169331.1 hypothetical protein [Aliivibrio sp. S4MY4]MDD9179811.1 hypothetical protein [Aliivibrio sp. A6]